ncbi:MAG: glycosyltransferase family 2 protein [Pseudomonadota bacterium]
MPDVAVIIVNYNAAQLAIEAVESVRARDHGGRTVEIHLVDNASPRGDAAVLAAALEDRGWAPGVTLYAETVNHGFGRGNNLVLDRLAEREDPPEFVLLLNPDAALKNEAIAIMVDFLVARPKAAVTGARCIKPDGHSVPASFRFPNIVSVFTAALSFGPVTRLLAGWRVAIDPEAGTRRVDWVSGASMLARFDALRAEGFFDPAYFLYFEEVDLMRRLARQGWETWYVAEAEVTHEEGASTDVKSARTERVRRPAYWYESWRIYFRAAYGRLGTLGIGAIWMLAALMNNGLSALRRREPAAPRHFFRDFWAVALRPLFGLEARPYD